MNSTLYADLEWLPRCVDFRSMRRDFEQVQGSFGPALRHLASHSLTTTQLQRVSAAIDGLQAAGHPATPLLPFKIGVLGTGTLTLLGAALRGTGARHGLLIDCVAADYGQIEQEALDPRSAVNRAGCDAILVALDYRSLPLCKPALNAVDAAASIDRSIATLRSICAGIRASGGTRIIMQTLAPPAETLFGSFDGQQTGSVSAMIAAFNTAVRAETENASTFVLDVNHLANTVGLANWHDPIQWNLAKLPFPADLTPLYADHVCRLLAAITGKARRALVLDLDNTLWGGVIGDDGLNGVVLGQGNATGEAFLEIQQLALTLRARGIVLAVASKNTDAVARSAFVEHPDMILRLSHIASFKANWDDKAANIRAIAQELSLGLDAFVFLDDNPAERELVRLYLPEVAVPELPEDPAFYTRTLAAAGYFETVTFLQEDLVRADYYQANAERNAVQATAGNIDQFLSGLEMHAMVQPFDAINRARIVQLVSKSSQFNLTTRRYTELEIAALEEDPLAFTMQVRLSDRLGDNGLISVVVCRPDGRKAWTIDTWLMSCRVLRRGVEKLVLREIVAQARARGIDVLRGLYRPTGRNALVEDHYAELGFSFDGEGNDGETRWSLSTATSIDAQWFEVARLYPALNVAA